MGVLGRSTSASLGSTVNEVGVSGNKYIETFKKRAKLENLTGVELARFIMGEKRNSNKVENIFIDEDLPREFLPTPEEIDTIMDVVRFTPQQNDWTGAFSEDNQFKGFEGLFDGIELHFSNEKVQVYDEKPSVEGLSATVIDLNGCYISPKNKTENPKVYLFMRNFGVYSVERKKKIVGTFVHEMFHAYFDTYPYRDDIREYIPKVSEAITEYSALRFLKLYNKDYYSNRKKSTSTSKIQRYSLGSVMVDDNFDFTHYYRNCSLLIFKKENLSEDIKEELSNDIKEYEKEKDDKECVCKLKKILDNRSIGLILRNKV